MVRLLFSVLISFALVFSAAGHLAMASTARVAAPASHATMHHAPDIGTNAVSHDRLAAGTVTAADPWNCCQPSPGAGTHACAVDTALFLAAPAMPPLFVGAPSYVQADDQAFGRAPAIPLKPPRAA
ncbi:hypothetical protein [Rhodobium gokarnense]|uniref:Uncharacterized protein n=1 Tax=Rhodobium gokarnense TaxID=364296 RepID=A0ABT3H8Z1_9HYPH|nr:hypothetical protein [Rhodobium gokarnense]MCW2306858.1 hypothetical protein [Rhodobium gokarnense]